MDTNSSFYREIVEPFVLSLSTPCQKQSHKYGSTKRYLSIVVRLRVQIIKSDLVIDIYFCWLLWLQYWTFLVVVNLFRKF